MVECVDEIELLSGNILLGHAGTKRHRSTLR